MYSYFLEINGEIEKVDDSKSLRDSDVNEELYFKNFERMLKSNGYKGYIAREDY